MVEVLTRLELGDLAGHDFHGNQWTGGAGRLDEVTSTLPLWRPGWSATQTKDGDIKLTTPDGPFLIQQNADLSTRLAQLADHLGVPLNEEPLKAGQLVRYDPSTGAAWDVTFVEAHPNGEAYVRWAGGAGEVDLNDLRPTTEQTPLPPVSDELRAPGSLSDDDRYLVRRFDGDLRGHPDAQAALNQFSMNSPNTLEAAQLRAALVDVAGADRAAEWVGGEDDDVSGYNDWMGEYRENDNEDFGAEPRGIPENLTYSDDLAQAAQMIHERYDSSDPDLDQTVTLYRGVAQQVSPGEGAVDLEVNVLSSWTTSPQVAENFGFPVTAEVPLRQIVAEGAIGEDEVLVYTPDQELQGRVTR